MTMLLLVAPWLLLLLALPFLLRQRPPLSDHPPARPADPPLVSVIVATQNDARRVGACLATLLDSGYPNFEVIVADAESRDGTREIVAALAGRAGGRVRLLDAGATPVGWWTRAWSCWRGFQESRGEVLLFTRPGTLHDSELLPRAMTALERERADLLSVYARLRMEGFWERLVMPHIWLMLTARLPTAPTVNRWQDPVDAVASPHFLLFRREAYEAIGGHQVVGERDPEASTLARAVLRAGRRVFLVHGEPYLETRMFRTLAGIANELVVATPATARIGSPGRLVQAAAWAVALMPVLLFVLPPATLIGSLLGLAGGATTGWAWRASLLSLAFWLLMHARHRIRPAYAVAYPAGALMSTLVFARAIMLQEET
jgi:hypothetical protein